LCRLGAEPPDPTVPRSPSPDQARSSVGPGSLRRSPTVSRARLAPAPLADRPTASAAPPQPVSGAYPPRIQPCRALSRRPRAGSYHLFGLSVAHLCGHDQWERCPRRCGSCPVSRLLGALEGLDLAGIGWVIAGGGSGPAARPPDPAWIRHLRDTCTGAVLLHWGGRTAPKPAAEPLDGQTWSRYPGSGSGSTRPKHLTSVYGVWPIDARQSLIRAGS
jgi:hypothetical protein